MAPDSKLLLGLEGAGGQGGAIHCREAIVAGRCLYGDLSERGMAGDLFPIRAGARVSTRVRSQHSVPQWAPGPQEHHHASRVNRFLITADRP